MTGIDSARSAGMPVVVVAANVNSHLEDGAPGILTRVPEFSRLSVPHLIGRAPRRASPAESPPRPLGATHGADLAFGI